MVGLGQIDETSKELFTNAFINLEQTQKESVLNAIPDKGGDKNIFEGMNDLRSSGNFNFIDGPLPRNLRSGSLYIPPKVHDKVLEKSEKILAAITDICQIDIFQLD